MALLPQPPHQRVSPGQITDQAHEAPGAEAAPAVWAPGPQALQRKLVQAAFHPSSGSPRSPTPRAVPQLGSRSCRLPRAPEKGHLPADLGTAQLEGTDAGKASSLLTLMQQSLQFSGGASKLRVCRWLCADAHLGPQAEHTHLATALGV